MKLNSEFYKKEELEENSIYSFKPIRSRDKKNSVGVSQSKILIDATIPYGNMRKWRTQGPVFTWHRGNFHARAR